MEESLTTGGAAALGLLSLALGAGVALIERAVSERRPPPDPKPDLNKEPWGQRWPRYHSAPRRGPRVFQG
ncbi:MAG: hypothetical protein U0359_13390 [Byssovorax sp.]